MTYNCLSISDLDEATVTRWREKGIVLFIGSYVSVFPPTNLPSGWATSRALWKKILQPSDLDFLKDDLDDVPFEAIMQCYPNRSTIRPIIRRMFSMHEPNLVHRCLASALATGKATSLITTNYDLALESALNEIGNYPTVFDESSFERFDSLHADSVGKRRVCFKIHGSAAAGAESSIVCDLDAEGWLPEWKRKLLFEMTNDRTLVIIGYSGSDFDICPELANSTRQAHTVWLQYDPVQIRPNAARVLREKRGIAVVGDLVQFLNVLFDEQLVLPAPVPQPINLDQFDSNAIPEWRVRVLNWIACPKLLSDTLAAINKDAQLFCAICGHTGRYLDSIKEMERTLRSSQLQGEERIRQEIQLTSSRFIYGQHLRSWIMLARIDKQIVELGSPLDLRILLIETRMMMLMRAAQLARAFNADRVLKKIQSAATPLYQEARQYLQTTGAWGRLEALQQNAERIGAATSDGLPLPTRRGYQSLGLISMFVITKRDWLRSGNWKLTSKKQEVGDNCLAKAEAYGWNHEAWKLSWILLWRGTGNKRAYLRSFRKYFWLTQYPFFSRFFQLFINLIPTGDEHDFEDEGYWI